MTPLVKVPAARTGGNPRRVAALKATPKWQACTNNF
jgi:hypothetical protein